MIPDWLSRGTHIVFVLVIVVAYAPLFFSSTIREWPWERFALLLGLVVAYWVLGTFGWDRLVEGDVWSGGAFLYFALQIGVIGVTQYITWEAPNSTWILLMPVAGQSMALPWWGTILACAGLLAGTAVVFKQDLTWESTLITMSGIATGMAFVLIFTRIALREVEARQEIERLAAELRQANRQLREYAVQAEELAVTQERNRMAREIHDTLGHYLTIINVQLGAGQAVLAQDPEKARRAMQKAQKLAQDGLADVRRSIASLRGSVVEQPLPQALADLLAETQAAGIVAELDVLGEPRPLDPRAHLTLYRAAQEGLTNTRKHASASRVDLTLDYRQPEQVSLHVVDNGVGAARAGDGFGLMGLRERVQLLDGSLAVETAVGRGFALHVQVPG
jgi:signal transduction histidine kinase